MLPNKLIITKKSKRKIIYEKYNDKWIIDFENRIKNWSTFYDNIQKEMDFWNYHKTFGKDNSTYSDIVGDLIIFEKMKEKKKEGIIFIFEYTKDFKEIEECEKKIIYWDLVYNLLVEWYIDNRIIFKNWEAFINIDIYILVEDNLVHDKVMDYNNELIIATENDKEIIESEYKSYNKLEIPFLKLNEINSLNNEKKFFNQLTIIKNSILNQLKVVIFNSSEIFHTLNIYLLVYIIENILIDKFIEGKEVKIFMIFSNELAE